MMCSMLWYVGALTCLASVATVVHASPEPPPYDVISQTLSGVPATSANVTYICTVTNQWTASRHPADYPSSPKLSPPLIVSHSRRFRLWWPGARAKAGIRTFLSTGNPGGLLFSILTTNRVLDEQVGESQDVLTVATQTIHEIHVSKYHRYLTTMVPFNPSPDWFSGFFGFNTIDQQSNTFLESFTINVYPWDGGTSNGTTYNSPGFVTTDGMTKITVATAPVSQVFLNPERTGILPVATWECRLQAPSL